MSCNVQWTRFELPKGSSSYHFFLQGTYVQCCECNKQNMDLVLNNIKGKNLEELMAEGAEKLASVGGGCGGGAAPAAAAAPADDAPAAKKEEKKEESEEEDDDMGFGLFD